MSFRLLLAGGILAGLVLAWVCFMPARLQLDEQQISFVRQGLSELEQKVSPECLTFQAVDEALNFNDGLSQTPQFIRFAVSVSNNWRAVLSDMDKIATNAVERLLLIGTGRVFGEDVYVEYINELATLKARGAVSSDELMWFMATSEISQLTCLWRRYREPRIRTVIDKLKVALPTGGGWDDVLSGAAYTNYLGEVEAGLWGENPLR